MPLNLQQGSHTFLISKPNSLKGTTYHNHVSGLLLQIWQFVQYGPANCTEVHKLQWKRESDAWLCRQWGPHKHHLFILIKLKTTSGKRTDKYKKHLEDIKELWEPCFSVGPSRLLAVLYCMWKELISFQAEPYCCRKEADSARMPTWVQLLTWVLTRSRHGSGKGKKQLGTATTGSPRI